MAPDPIRLYHPATGRHFIVNGGQVFPAPGEENRGRVSDADLLEAADYFAELYDIPSYDVPNRNRTITSGGPLNMAEVIQLERDPRAIPVARTALERHLDFFDETRDGRITIGENWRGWRRLGYGFFRSLLGMLGAAIVFGRPWKLFSIDIAHIKSKRPAQKTNIYDANGEVDKQRLRDYLAEFDREATEGFITQENAFAIIERKAHPGYVSKRQFKSLFDLCTRLNHNEKVISREQFEHLFDGSLLYLAASIPDEHGRRGADRGHSLTKVEGSVILVLVALAVASVRNGLTLTEWLTVWPMIFLTTAIAIGQQWRPLLQYIFFCRFSLLVAGILMLLPAIGLWVGPLLFKAMLMLDWGGLIFVALLTVLAAEVCVATASVIARYAHLRFVVQEWTAPADVIDRNEGLLVAVVAFPLLVTLFVNSEAAWPLAAVALLAGVALSVAFKKIAIAIGNLVMPKDDPAWQATPVDRRGRALPHGLEAKMRAARKNVAERLKNALVSPAGYLDPDGWLLPGHLANAAFFATTLALYIAGFWLLKPNGLLQAPALAFVIFILIMLGWFLTALSFFADKYRVSSVVALAVVPFVLYFINDIDHYYRLQPASAAGQPASTGSTGQGELRTAFNARLNRLRATYPAGEPVIIAVAAGGGGGSAALWSARVLAGLQQDIGPRFTDSVHLVSSVSGGSVGTLYFLNAFDPPPSPGGVAVAPSDARLEKVVRTAGTSTLSSIAWGLSYPDFWRLFSLRHWDPYVDRGWAMEETLDSMLGKDRGERLSQWREGILAGWRPAVLFNATVSETGQRLVLSPLHLTQSKPDCGIGCDDQIDASTLNGLYASSSDLRVATAARLSATFPFVMPIPKPRGVGAKESAFHIADGGYYDNDGLLTLVEWARKALDFSDPSVVHKMLVIDIRLVDPAPELQKRAGWIYATAGPVLTMLSARGASQVSRNTVDVNLLSDSRQAAKFEIKPVEFPLSTLTSRAWHLPASEKDQIETYWKNEAAIRRMRCEVKKFVIGGDCPSPPY